MRISAGGLGAFAADVRLVPRSFEVVELSEQAPKKLQDEPSSSTESTTTVKNNRPFEAKAWFIMPIVIYATFLALCVYFLAIDSPYVIQPLAGNNGRYAYELHLLPAVKKACSACLNIDLQGLYGSTGLRRILTEGEVPENAVGVVMHSVELKPKTMIGFHIQCPMELGPLQRVVIASDENIKIRSMVVVDNGADVRYSFNNVTITADTTTTAEYTGEQPGNLCKNFCHLMTRSHLLWGWAFGSKPGITSRARQFMMAFVAMSLILLCTSVFAQLRGMGGDATTSGGATAGFCLLSLVIIYAGCGFLTALNVFPPDSWKRFHKAAYNPSLHDEERPLVLGKISHWLAVGFTFVIFVVSLAVAVAKVHVMTDTECDEWGITTILLMIITCGPAEIIRCLVFAGILTAFNHTASDGLIFFDWLYQDSMKGRWNGDSERGTEQYNRVDNTNPGSPLATPVSRAPPGEEDATITEEVPRKPPDTFIV